MPKVSVIIPTYNRPNYIEGAIQSVLKQSYQDFEIIVIDDGLEKRAEKVINKLNNNKIKYIKHEKEKGGAAARNTGIRAAQGQYVAFLDDDDEWMSEKLEIQMSKFEKTSKEVGFCFTAVKNNMDKGIVDSKVFDGINDFYELALKRFKGFLTVTLIIKKEVFKDVGLFDERFPSHQEPDLMIRVTKKYKGLGINKPLVLVNMKSDHEHIGGSLKRRIAGREMILQKYLDEFSSRPKVLASHYFQLAIFYRDDGDFKHARKYFLMAWLKSVVKIRYLVHYTSMLIK